MTKPGSSYQTRSKKDFAKLELALSYQFATPELLARALTHSSLSGELDDPKTAIVVGEAVSAARGLSSLSWNYERLEFLGDRVLGLVIAERLLMAFPSAVEGELARRFNQLVRKETCADVARDLDLGNFILMSNAERQSGGDSKKTILGDCCEAVLGAVFLDGGFNAAQTVILRFWELKIADSDDVPTDAKSALQEWAQGLSLPIPNYVEIKRSGPDHAPKFELEVRIKTKTAAYGEGASKRAAQQDAARAFLVREGIWKGLEP